MNEQAYLDNLRQARARNWPAGVPAERQYPQGVKPLFEYLRHWAREIPEAVALHFYGQETTWRELDELSDRFANLLASLGLRPGDAVAVFMPNCPQFNIAYHGIMKYGAIHVPVSPLSKELELTHSLNDSEAKAIVCFDGLLPVVEPVCAKLGIEHVITTSISELKPDAPTMPLPDLFDLPKVEVKDGLIDFFPALQTVSAKAPEHTPGIDDVAALNYTGGTTGLPKGCIHTHRTIIDAVAGFYPLVFREESYGQDHTLISYLPEFWIAGEDTGLLFPTFGGNTLVLLAKWDAVAFMTGIQHYQANSTIILVDSIDEMLNHPDLDQFDLTSLDFTACISFIKKLNKDYRRRWFEVSGSIMFETAYGMTETHTLDTFTRGYQEDDYDLNIEPAFVGMPAPGVEIKICDFETGELKPLGEEGEIVVRTSKLFKGYWNKPEINAELLVDGWFRTGDLGCLTEEGFLRYLGRRKEMLKMNGISVFPTEVEGMLGMNPAIAACGVIGRPDEKKGQVPVAFLMLKPGSEETEESLREWCKDAMAYYKVPEIRIVDSLPMTATGKIKKNELEEML